MKKLIFFAVAIAMTLAIGTGCKGVMVGNAVGDTLQMRYAERIKIVECDGYSVVTLADPWNTGKTLHAYLLVPGDGSTVQDDSLKAMHPGATIVHTPLKKVLIATSVHCALTDELGAASAVGGVCDLQYINLYWVKDGVKAGKIRDCGSALSPTIESIIDLSPDAIFLSPFQNSGGYGRVSELNIPIIETADYMETSPLGRAEWMRFYGMLFGKAQQADSLFAEVERVYRELSGLEEGGERNEEGKVIEERGKRSEEGEHQHDMAAVKQSISPSSLPVPPSSQHPSILMDKLTGSVWYVPGGKSTIGQMIRDAGIGYAWSDDESSGSLSLPFEAVLEKAMDADIWLFRYSAPHDITAKELLSEKAGYSQFRAFREGNIYGCNNSLNTFYEDTPFHPERLLRDFICIAHPERGLGAPKYFVKVKQ